jgi:hypothetical protein
MALFFSFSFVLSLKKSSIGEQRNHDLKYELDCVSIGIGIKI